PRYEGRTSRSVRAPIWRAAHRAVPPATRDGPVGPSERVTSQRDGRPTYPLRGTDQSRRQSGGAGRGYPRALRPATRDGPVGPSELLGVAQEMRRDAPATRDGPVGPSEFLPPRGWPAGCDARYEGRTSRSVRVAPVGAGLALERPPATRDGP